MTALSTLHLPLTSPQGSAPTSMAQNCESQGTLLEKYTASLC
jgi:hypothetical protein